jgi:hypothetical protein
MIRPRIFSRAVPVPNRPKSPPSTPKAASTQVTMRAQFFPLRTWIASRM